MEDKTIKRGISLDSDTSSLFEFVNHQLVMSEMQKDEEKRNAEEPGKGTTNEEGEDATKSSEQATLPSAASGVIQGVYNTITNWLPGRQS